MSNFGGLSGETPAPQNRKPFTRKMLLQKEILETVVNNEYLMYIPAATKAVVDALTDPAPSHLKFMPPEEGTDHFWMVPARPGEDGAEEISESESKGAGTINVLVPFRIMRVKRAGVGRKERFEVKFDPASPYGPAIKVLIKPLSNEPVTPRPRKKKSGSDAAKANVAPAKAGANAGANAEKSVAEAAKAEAEGAAAAPGSVTEPSGGGEPSAQAQ